MLLQLFLAHLLLREVSRLQLEESGLMRHGPGRVHVHLLRKRRMHLATKVNVEAGGVKPVRKCRVCVGLPIAVEGAQELHGVVELPRARLLDCLVLYSVLGSSLHDPATSRQPARLRRLQAVIIQQLRRLYLSILDRTGLLLARIDRLLRASPSNHLLRRLPFALILLRIRFRTRGVAAAVR